MLSKSIPVFAAATAVIAGTEFATSLAKSHSLSSGATSRSPSSSLIVLLDQSCSSKLKDAIEACTGAPGSPGTVTNVSVDTVVRVWPADSSSQILGAVQAPSAKAWSIPDHPDGDSSADLIAPRGSASFTGRIMMKADDYYTRQAKAASALCNTLKLCKFLDRMASPWECVSGVSHLDSDDVWEYVTTAISCRDAIKDQLESNETKLSDETKMINDHAKIFSDSFKSSLDHGWDLFGHGMEFVDIIR